MGRFAALLLVVAGAGRSLAAQGIPPYEAMNPLLFSRSGLWFQPYVDSAAPWQVRFLTDYASIVEYIDLAQSKLVLDAELLRLDATVTRNIGPVFVGGQVSFNAAYPGFMDGFLDWYHDLIGLQVAARKLRPRDQFEYSIRLPDGREFERSRSSGFLGDVRLLAGHRHTRHWQTTIGVTLPTNGGPTGYGRETASVSGVTTARLPLDHRWTTELSAGAGYTPKHGDLTAYQRTFFHSASAGVRYRFSGKQAGFLNLFYQSASYRDTGMRAFDNRELTLDYGFLLRARKGPEWFLGMTEDLEPRGPAIDLSFRIGARW